MLEIKIKFFWIEIVAKKILKKYFLKLYRFLIFLNFRRFFKAFFTHDIGLK